MVRRIYKNFVVVSLVVLLFAAIMIFSAFYSAFNKQIEAEIRLRADIVAGFLEQSAASYKAVTEERLPDGDENAYLVFAVDGSLLYSRDPGNVFDLSEDFVFEHKEITEAFENGSAAAEYYRSPLQGKLYCYAKRLADGNVLLTASTTLDIGTLLFELSAIFLFLVLLIFAIGVVFARLLTANIVSPIENISFSETDEPLSPYPELQPFVNKLSYQSREVKRQMDHAKRQKLRLQAVSESMSEGLAVLDRDGNILSINHSAMQAFGVTDPEAVKNTGILLLVKNDRAFADNLANALHNKRGSFYHTLGAHTYEIFYSPVCDGNSVMGVIVLMFDMTDKLKNEQIRAEFTANVSHELKTPLTSIHGYAQLIGSGMAGAEDIMVFVGKIEKESRRLIALVEDIIKLSNLDEGAEPEKTVFAVRPMLFEIAEYLKLAAESRGIHFEIGAGDFMVRAGESQIHELLYNIMDNAVKYNKNGGSVRIGIERGIVTIADTGIGIPKEYHERVFERFFRVDKSHSKTVNGTGLGLSIVKHIAMNNGIRVDVSDNPGGGTVFTVNFESCLRG